ncbi:type IX secretion system membrane protein PorP/SprF [Formosa sp. L2A11]|uniref:PorP/SprF family type IX secretion system membrane protein n=1 Tax=Formosa sp. L2A11 TaxID=2686363 RepID=UPI00131E6FFA|nr:type IX secretion system membrane protein PorP/SprF [Formosa sp. L2A11]
MKKEYYLLMLLTLVLFKAPKLRAQQEIQFTQYIFNTLSVNPAYAGYKDQWFAQVGLRNQWAGLDGAPQTGQVSIDGIVSEDTRNVGVGLQVTSDQLGPQKATTIYGNYAYRLRLNDEDTQRLSFGIGAGIGSYGLDGSMFSAVNGSDADLYNTNETVWKWNIRLGVYYYSPKWYAGVSFMNILEDTENYLFGTDDTYYNIDQNKHMYFIAGALFDMNSYLKLKPSILVKEDFKGTTSLDINGMLIFNDKFWFGASYRTGISLWDKDYVDYSESLKSTNAISGIVQFYVNDKLRIGYSYDYMLNTLGNSENGSHELTLGYTFSSSSKRLISPRFF